VEKSVANFRDFYARVERGEVTYAEFRERLYTATLYVLAVAYLIGRAVARFTPVVLSVLKKVLLNASNVIPETKNKADQHPEERLSGV
jgi:hypothetical protein